MNWNGDPHTSWTISVTVSNVHLKNLNGIRIHDLCAAGAVLLLTMNHEPTQMWAGQFLDSCVPVKEMFMKCGWGMNWRTLGKNVLTEILHFLSSCSKVVVFLHVTQHYCMCQFLEIKNKPAKIIIEHLFSW